MSVAVAKLVCEILCATYPHARIEVHPAITKGEYLLRAVVFLTPDSTRWKHSTYCLSVETTPLAPFRIGLFQEGPGHDLARAELYHPATFRGPVSLQVWLNHLNTTFLPFTTLIQVAPYRQLSGYVYLPRIARLLWQDWTENACGHRIRYHNAPLLTGLSPTSALFGDLNGQYDLQLIRPGDPEGLALLKYAGTQRVVDLDLWALTERIENIVKRLRPGEDDDSPFW